MATVSFALVARALFAKVNTLPSFRFKWSFFKEVSTSVIPTEVVYLMQTMIVAC